MIYFCSYQTNREKHEPDEKELEKVNSAEVLRNF